MPDVVSETHHRWHNGFFKSNLFVFLLGQTFAFICWLCIVAFGWGKYSERFSAQNTRISSVETTQKRMDNHGSTYTQNVQGQQTLQIAELSARVERMERETSHLDVMEYEHRRLTEDIEKLKNDKAKK